MFGGHSINPQVNRMRQAATEKHASGKADQHKPSIAKPIGSEQAAPHGHVELHKDHPEAGGKPYTTIHHKGDGAQPELRHHDSKHQAHHAMNEHFAEDGCKAEGEGCEHDEGNEAEESGSMADLGFGSVDEDQ